jgi:hypothetical protein
MFYSFEMFCDVMDACTENYECLVINTSSKSNKLEEQVYWYKAENHEDFRICCQDAWTYSEQNYNEEEEEETEANLNKLYQKRNTRARREADGYGHCQRGQRWSQNVIIYTN